MNVRPFRVLFALVPAALAASATAQANVTQLSSVKFLDYSQTSDNAASLSFIFADFVVTTASEGEADGGLINLPDGTSLAGAPNFADQVRFTKSFSSIAAMDQAFAPGNFNFSLSSAAGGSPNPMGSGSFVQPDIQFPDSVPFLSGDSYSRLNGLDASQAIDLTFNSGSGDTNFFVIGTSYYGTGTTGVTVPADTFLPNTTYTYVVNKRTSVLTSGSFGSLNPDSYANTLVTTVGQFTTAEAVPEPASMAAVGIGVAALLRRRRK